MVVANVVGWSALREVFPEARQGRCWFDKTANVLAALPKSAHPGAGRPGSRAAGLAVAFKLIKSAQDRCRAGESTPPRRAGPRWRTIPLRQSDRTRTSERGMSTEPSPSQPRRRPPSLIGPRWPWFAVWLIVGASYAVSILGAASIGLFLLPLPALATILLARRPHANSGLPGLISGLGIPLLYVAYLNRAGPGTICTTTSAGQYCTDEWSPWPWLAAAVVLLVLGAAAFIVRQRHLHRQPASTSHAKPT